MTQLDPQPKQPHNPTLLTRRRWGLLGLLTAALPQWACSQDGRGSTMKANSATLSDEDAALMRRFRGVKGGELRIDAPVAVGPVALFLENGLVFQRNSGGYGGRGGTISSYGGSGSGDNLVVPKTLRMIRYSKDSRPVNLTTPFVAFDGAVVADVTVPVASRIPDDVLDTARRFGGGLRLKLRLTLDTILVGWDVRNYPEFQPGKRDQFGVLLTGPVVYHAVGGDFREAEIVNGIAVRKGWYIDPKTGQKIETDF
jgi:hypothetical protein